MQSRDILKTLGTSPLTLGMAARSLSFPERPVRIITSFAAGNTLDSTLRQAGEIFKVNNGEPILMDLSPLPSCRRNSDRSIKLNRSAGRTRSGPAGSRRRIAGNANGQAGVRLYLVANLKHR